MLRLTVRTDDASMAANVGGAVLTTHRSFDVDLPALEAFLREKHHSLCHRQVVGYELLDDARALQSEERDTNG